jgi:hypothetical protein
LPRKKFHWCASLRDVRECVLFYVQSLRLTLEIFHFCDHPEAPFQIYIALTSIVGSRCAGNINVVRRLPIRTIQPEVASFASR